MVVETCRALASTTPNSLSGKNIGPGCVPVVVLSLWCSFALLFSPFLDFLLRMVPVDFVRPVNLVESSI